MIELAGALPVFSHTTLGVSDVEAARRLYEPLLAKLGQSLRFVEDNWAGWMPPHGGRPLFIIMKPFDGNDPQPGNGTMVALLAPSRKAVDECHALALEHGGSDEGAPGLRPHYHPHYYGAYFRDLDGNKLCVVCHEEE